MSMATPLDQLARLNRPLTDDSIAEVIGHPPAAIRRVIAELNLPCSYFVKAYSLAQVKVILDKLTSEQIERIATTQSKGPNHETPRRQFPNRQPRISNPTADYRESLDARRAARVRR